MGFDREAGRRLLRELAELLSTAGVPYFLMQGTALGAYRDQDFTPTELDVDLGALAEYFVPKTAILKDLLELTGFGVELISAPFRRVRTIVAHKYGVKADLVSWARWKDRRFASSPVDPVHVPRPYCIVHEAAQLETYQLVELFGRPYYVPSPVEQYLAREYGPDWRTPREDHISRTRIYNYVQAEGMPDDVFG